jgi:hypothetical protein
MIYSSKVLIVVGFCALLTVAFSSNESTYALESQVSEPVSLPLVTVNIQALGPVQFDMPNQARPNLVSCAYYAFNITFFKPNSHKSIKNVKYNIDIVYQGKEVFDTSKLSPNGFMYTDNASATVRYILMNLLRIGLFVVAIERGERIKKASMRDTKLLILAS